MKLLRTHRNRFVFLIGNQDKRLLLTLVRKYPLVPAAYPRASKSGLPGSDAQQLLEEALAAQRSGNQRQALRLLQRHGRFKKHGAGYRLSLSAAQMECLLQVLNDVRVGSWLLLGSPEERQERIHLVDDLAPVYWTMHLAGYFQMVLLKALSGQTDGA